MPGLYLHIPFCKQACTYCDFHFRTNQGSRDAVLSAMHQELQQRRDELSGTIGSIYLGGGTPSLMGPVEMGGLLTRMRDLFIVEPTD